MQAQSILRKEYPTFVAVAVWHLYVHEDQVEWPAILRSTLQSVYGFEAVEIGIALETELLHEADGDTLVDQIVLCNADPKITSGDGREVDTSARGVLVPIVLLAREPSHGVWLSVPLLLVSCLGFWDLFEAQ